MFDPDTHPEIKKMRAAYARLEKAEAEADQKRQQLLDRAREARTSATNREQQAEELEREIRRVFINGADGQAFKLREQQEGERRRAAMDRDKAEALEAEADQVVPARPDVETHPDPGREFWRLVSLAIQQELTGSFARLAEVGAMADGYFRKTHVHPLHFVKRALSAQWPGASAGLQLDVEDREMPRQGLLAELIHRGGSAEEDAA